MADPLAPFGYVVNRLTPGGDDGGLICQEAYPIGTPLLILPLHCCWSLTSLQRECPRISEALRAAKARNPQSKLLQSHQVAVALHLVHERHLGDSAHAHRRAHLDLIPEVFQTLFAWSKRDLESIRGSSWHSEVLRRKKQLAVECRELALELGTETVKSCGFDEASYRWAMQVLLQFGMHSLAADGSSVDIIAPGLELLDIEEEAQPALAGARLEFLGTDSVIAVFAARDYRKGERVVLSHGGLACSTGMRLLTCGRTLDPNPWENAELVVRLPLNPGTVADDHKFWTIVNGLSASLTQQIHARCGDFISADIAGGWSSVEVHEGGAEPELCIHLRLSKDQPLPPRNSLVYLGVAVLAHAPRLQKIMQDERGIVDVLGEEQCERRALTFLQGEMKAALEQLSAAPPEDEMQLAESSTKGWKPRVERGAQLVLAEKNVLENSLDIVNDRLALQPGSAGRPLPKRDAQGSLVQGLRSSVGEPAPKTEVAQELSKLRGCTQAVSNLGVLFTELRSAKRYEESDAKQLKEEMPILIKMIENSRLGNPTATESPLKTSEDPVVRAQGEANTAVLCTTLASLEWDIARLEQKVLNKQEDAKNPLHRALTSAVTLRMRLRSYEDALVDLRRCSQLLPDAIEDNKECALECAQILGAQSDQVLGAQSVDSLIAALQNSRATLKVLRDRMQAFGYTTAGLRWPWPARLPQVTNLATYNRSVWGRGVEMGFLDVAKGLKPGAFGPEPPESMVPSPDKLHTLIKLFMLREVVPLRRVALVIGTEACKLLLQLCIVSGYEESSMKLLEPDEVIKVLSSKETKVVAFANLVLWPVEGDLMVAVDFDQGVHIEGQFEPVIYLGEDSKALVASSPAKPKATKVLDACCGCGAQGLVALRRYAEKATFMDKSPRALRFACFSSFLNGLDSQCTFVRGSLCDDVLPSKLEGPFDAVLAGISTLPNPDTVVTSAGPMFFDGGKEGEFLEKAVSKGASQLLATGGRLVVTGIMGSPETLVTRLQSWADTAQVHASVFRGDSIPVLEMAQAATEGCTEAQMWGYARGLEQQGIATLSQVVILLYKWPSGTEAGISAMPKVQLHDEHRGLWADTLYLETEVHAAANRLSNALSMDTALTDSSEKSLFSLDWEDGQESDLEPQVLEVTPADTTLDVRPKTSSTTLPIASGEAKGVEGATWDDINAIPVRGFAPPVLCDVLWKEAGIPEENKPVPHIYRSKPPKSQFKTSIVDVWGCRYPKEVRKAMASALGCDDRLCFEGQPRTLRHAEGPSKSGQKPASCSFDVLIVPLVGWSEGGTSLAELTNEVLELLKVLCTDLENYKHPVRVVLLTSGSNGPSFIDGTDGHVDAAAPVRGLVRVARAEIPQIPVLCIDTDAFWAGDDGSMLAEEVASELDLSTPSVGMNAASPAQKAMAFYQTNREVAYRYGQRYSLKLDLSSRMPIYAQRAAPMLPRSVAEGVILVTGGTAGLGLIAAEALLEVGAECVVLVSRFASEFAASRLSDSKKGGAKVAVESCNVADEDEVIEMLSRVREQHGPIRLVVHSSGQLDDRPIQKQDLESLEVVFAHKAYGALFLHRNTLEDDLHGFILFSSVSALYGYPQQANSAAADTFMDELARLRKAQSLPGVSIQWPSVTELGKPATNKAGQHTSITAGVMKQVVKQVVCGKEKMSPVQAVLTEAHLTPPSPLVASLLEPLLSRGSSEYQAEIKEKMRKMRS